MDVEQVFRGLTARPSGAAGPPVKSGWVYRYAVSPISLWCDLNAPQDLKDEIDPFTQYLFDRGMSHEAAVLTEMFPGATREYFSNEENGFHRTLELMAEGVASIQNMPLLGGPLGLEGRPDVLERVDGVPSDLGNHSYRVVEIKFARHIKRGHVLQASAYNRLLGLAQGYEPEGFAVLNGDNQLIPYLMSEWDDRLDEALEAIREILKGVLLEPSLGGGEWPWKTYVDRLAVQRNDVTLLTGIGAARRQELVNAGFSRVDQVALADESALAGIRGIGQKTAALLRASAQALEQNGVVRRAATPDVTRGSTEVFFDFEGTDPQMGSEGLDVTNYLIGNVWRAPNGKPEFLPFFASSVFEEEANLRAFLDWASSLDDPVFYHWHHYEKTHLEKMGDFYEVDPGQLQWVIDRMVNLVPPVTDSFAFPCYGRGLKDIAKSLGFRWRQDDVDGAGSVVLFRRFVESGGTATEIKDKILTYNEDDCSATMFVFDWLMDQED